MKTFGTESQLSSVSWNTSSDSKVVSISPPATLTGASNTFTTPSIAGTTDVLLSRTSTDTLTNKTLVAPALGTPTTLVLTNATGLVLTTGVTGTLPVANGGTGVTSSTGTGSTVLSSAPALTSPTIATALTMLAAAPIKFNNATNTFFTALIGGNAAADLTFTLPITDGAAGQTIKTNGSGVLGWVSAATNPMSATGDVMYSSDNSGTVARLGIGNTSQRLGVAAGIPAWSNTITGASDIVQEKILGNATQTNNIFEVQKSDTTSLFAITNTTGTNIRGTTTNTTIGTGFVGEVVNSGSVGTGVTVSNSPKSLGSISLTAGNWVIYATANYNGSSGNTNFQAYINSIVDSSSGTTFGVAKGIGFVVTASGVGTAVTLHSPASISSTTTFYINCETSTGSAGSGGILGSIFAVRIA